MLSVPLKRTHGKRTTETTSREFEGKTKWSASGAFDQHAKSEVKNFTKGCVFHCRQSSYLTEGDIVGC